MRPIDADLVVYAAEGEFSEEDAAKVRWLISHIPTICAEPVRHAKAVFKVRRKWDGSAEGITETVPYCSDCGKRIDDLSALWCAGCGAKMDAEVHE